MAQDRTVFVMIRHLSIFPHFLSTGGVPLPANGLRNSSFDNASAAAIEMDELRGRTIRLVRSLDTYGLGAEPGPVSVGTLREQEVSLQDLSA
jgi:hypothetical protein